ncbi:MAG: hypothetical protein K8T89_24470 [Planctomycetes bacterium]|nr:hypothetical protein [Planctomycetota bacterium]
MSQPSTNESPASAAAPPLVEQIFLGVLSALLIARVLVASDDPGRLRLTTGGGPLTLNIVSFLLLIGWSIWRGCTRRPLRKGPMNLVAVGLVIIAGLVFLSAGQPDRYQRPGWFIAWDWVSIAILCFLTGQLASTPMMARRVAAVLIATAACLAAQALYQSAAVKLGLPETLPDPPPESSVPLVGDEEFALKLAPVRPARDAFRATFDASSTLASFLFLFLPAAFLWSYAGWRGPGRGRLTFLVFGLIAAAFAIALSGSLKTYWTSPEGGLAVKLIAAAPWLGIGPGNYSRHAVDQLFEPNNFWLSFAATTGLIALGVLVVTLFFSLFLGFRRWKTAPEEAVHELAQTSTTWIFYQAGISGLLLGMILATGDIPIEAPASEILRLGCVAAGRSLVWFFVFALLEYVSFDARLLTPALLMGVLGVALAGLVASSLFSPALMLCFWVTLTLALTFLGKPSTAQRASLVSAWIVLPAAIAILITNLVHVAQPGLSTAAKVRAAREASKEFPVKNWNIEGKTGADRLVAIRQANDYLYTYIIYPLHEAEGNDPNNSALKLELAHWNRWHWRYLNERKEDRLARQEALDMLTMGGKAAKLDPRNLGAKLSVYDSLLLFTSTSATASKEQLDSLDKYIKLIAEREPNREVGLRHRVVLALLKGRNVEALDSWSVQLLRLDDDPEGKQGKLSPLERTSLLARLREKVQYPSMELAEYILGLSFK